jgi:excinuclease UvrABC nuclease subunit
MLRLRTPALLKVNLPNAYPRCYVTRRISANGGFYLGPFATRKSAEELGNRVLDVLRVRRCQIRIRRDPEFPGCIYSEMKMCLAPCFAGCTAEAYDEEAARLVESLATRGLSLSRSLEMERDAASDATEFEKAATLQKKLEKVNDAFRGFPEIARRVEELDAVILQRGIADGSIALFPVREGVFQDPIFMDFSEVGKKPHSAEETLRAALEKPRVESNIDAPPSGKAAVAPVIPPQDEQDAGSKELVPVEELGAGAADTIQTNYRQRFALQSAHPDLGENLALFARWFYSNPREGEILFRDEDWPYRRILRACSRLLRPDGKQSPLPPTIAGPSA